jgi:hypothetical protein
MRDEGKSAIAAAKSYIERVKKSVIEARQELKTMDQGLAKQSKDVTEECKQAIKDFHSEDASQVKKHKSALLKEAAAKRKAIKAQRQELKTLLELCK